MRIFWHTLFNWQLSWNQISRQPVTGAQSPLNNRGPVQRTIGISMFLVTSPIVINVPTRGLLAVETMHAIVRRLANFNIKRSMTSMFVKKKHSYR